LPLSDPGNTRSRSTRTFA